MLIHKREQLLKIIVFLFGGILLASSQNISIVDESCKKPTCSCCANYTCIPIGDICAYGCKPGYHGGRCFNLCPSNCINCVDKPNLAAVANCLTCKNGYFSTTELYQCQSKCPSECQICESVTNCTLCKDRHYLSTKQPGSCFPCPVGCASCLSENKCNSCDRGYFLPSSSGSYVTCHSCPLECVSCTSNEDCEICKTGYYGKTCQDRCSHGCQNIYCLKDNVQCECKVGFTGPKCDTCVNGKYGPECNQSCPENCLNDECKRESGECLFCDKPFVGAFCENCSTGMYGLSCNLRCSKSCNQSVCNRFTGFCESCKKNHEGDTCEFCKAGKYGEECSFDCPQNCLDDLCDRSDGTCFNCSENTVGLRCDRCREKFYDFPRCWEKCSSKCRNLTCYQDTGVCDKGCEDGFTGDKCCLYDPYCEKCSSNEKCSKCIPGKFGERCNGSCIEICVDRTCDKRKGICLKNKLKDNVTTITVAVGGVVFAAIVIIAAFFILRKRTHKEKKTNNSFAFSKLIANEEFGENNDKPFNYVGNMIKNKVNVNQLATYVSRKTKDSYTREFKNLPDGLIKSCTDARKPENIAKNRYQSIYPYDEHRVKLAGPGSDFINASYVDGFKREKEYIASLGPIKKATENFLLFWRMMWQEKAEKIVMVTNLIENGVMKCEQYWPTVGNADCYGDVIVTCLSEDVYSEFTRRTFTVAKGKKKRSLVHLHFTAWPDKGVPSDVTSIIEFRQRVLATKTTLAGPTIVHCSAGIGRTGTYIALDRLTKQGEKEKAIDVFQCVFNMRQHRTKMVQTEEQYEYLHHAIVHSLTFGCDAISATKFKQYVASCSDEMMQSKFEKLNNNKEKLPEKETKAMLNNKRREELNRAGADVPGNLHRVTLYEGRTTEENNYINAVYVNSYKQKNRYIVAQTPLPITVVDFVTMVIQERISCIVSMDVDNRIDTSVGMYIPTDNSAMEIGHFEISSATVASNSCYTLKKLTIRWEAKAIVRTVTYYQCSHWRDNMSVPDDVSMFLQFIQDVEKTADADTNKGPILVHCLNGAERSGLFCAVFIMLQKIKIEQEVSVVNTLRQLKVRRAQAIPNKEQYIFCHKCISSYLATSEDNVL